MLIVGFFKLNDVDCCPETKSYLGVWSVDGGGWGAGGSAFRFGVDGRRGGVSCDVREVTGVFGGGSPRYMS